MIERLRALFTLFSKRKESEVVTADVSRSDDERERFFANLSHEIRTPVNGIVGFTQLLKETPLSNEQNELVNTIHSSSMHLLSLVSDILDFSKINANKLEFESIPFDLFRQVEDTVEVYAALSQKKRIELSVFIDPTITPMLIGDPTKLSQVIGNLVSNAIKFTEVHGEVYVRVDKLKEDPKTITLEFSVKDTGIGIEAQDQEKIFDAFVQANSSINREFGGTGLGLAISSKIVKFMGGQLKLYSSFGIGSEFSFILSFEKTRAKERKLYHDLYMGLKIGFLLPMVGAQKVADSNLKKNIEYLGADFMMFYGNEIFSMEKIHYPDILFVDESRNTIDLKKLSELGIKIVLIRTLDAEENPNTAPGTFCKVLYKPLNLAKTIRALEVCTDDKKLIAEGTAEANKDFHGLRALIVDDNEINQKLLVKLLSDMQMDTEVASDGAEAIEFYQSIAFDIILMDIEMPVMGGIEATQKILAYEEEMGIAHTPVIALTGNVSTEDLKEYKEAGLDSAISKPIDVEILIAHLNKYALGKNLVEQIEKEQPTLYGAKALIIEDNVIDQKLIERALASRGVESVSVVTGSDIVETYQRMPFDIIFINASTPVMNAIETTKHIRAFEKSVALPRVPIVVMLSSDSQEQHFDLYKEIGADGYLLKPLDIDEIKFQLDQYIQEASLLDRVTIEEKETALSDTKVSEVSADDVGSQQEQHTECESVEEEKASLERSEEKEREGAIASQEEVLSHIAEKEVLWETEEKAATAEDEPSLEAVDVDMVLEDISHEGTEALALEEAHIEVMEESTIEVVEETEVETVEDDMPIKSTSPAPKSFSTTEELEENSPVSSEREDEGTVAIEEINMETVEIVEVLQEEEIVEKTSKTEEEIPLQEAEEATPSVEEQTVTSETKTSQYTITYIDIPLSK